MKRVIIASGFDRYGGTHGNENMTDDQILWEEMHDAWQDRCRKAYNSIVDSDQIYDFNWGTLIDYVADHARVDTNIAAYFVDESMEKEPEPLPLKELTRMSPKHQIQASTSAKYFGRRVEIDENGDIELICYDPEYDEDFEKYVGQGATAEKNLRMLRKDRYFDVSENLLKKIERLI